jgi:hypothetical protein
MVMKIITVLSAALLLVGCVAARFSHTSAGRVVVPAVQLPGGSRHPAWTPTEDQIASCEAALARTLAKNKRDLGDYYLRLGGAVRDGKRHIIGIAAHKATGTHYLLPAAEDTWVLPTFGGGEAFFSFDYDVDGRTLTRLDFNAPL